MNVSIFKLCKELLKLSVDLIPTGPMTKKLLTAFIESVSEQTASINQKLDQLLDAPYKNGLDFLRSAESISNPDLKRQSIVDAKNQFVDASNKTVAATAKVQSIFYVGVCFTLLNEPIAALQWYERAYQTGWDYRLKLLQSLRDTFMNFPGPALRWTDALFRGELMIMMGSLWVKELVKASPSLVKASINAERNKSELIYLENNLLRPLKELLESKSSSLPVLQHPLNPW